MTHRPGKRAIAIIVGALVGAFWLGTWSGGGSGPRDPDITATGHAHDHADPGAGDAAATDYTCSMHPNVRQAEPGKCPLCGMDLIPVASDAAESRSPREIKLTPSARKLAQVVTAPVERKAVTADVRMVGKIAYDETRVRRITAWVPGRLERLFVDYTGIPVKKGDHMVVVFSPELISAQRELIEAKRAASKFAGSGLETVRDAARQTLVAAREKLRLWGLTKGQIKRIERRGRTEEKITLYAPMSGIVVHKDAIEGMYVQTGTPIYTIADMSHLWLTLDAYESDLPWIRYGQEVSFDTEAYPGREFTGRISFVSPILDPKTRTVKVRVNVPNEDGALKPEMFVRAIVSAAVMGEGRVMEPHLAGKWMCPMHPEVVADEAGDCGVCGMDLVPTESLGFVSPEETEPPLVVPVTAPLITGKRAVVYVADPDEDGVYEGRELVLGPRAGDFYVVREGLKEGERVVVNGNFKIDSAIQILAGPSMMNPEGGGPPPGHHHGDHAGHAAGDAADAPAKPPSRAKTPEAFRGALSAVFTAYFTMERGLADDALEASIEAVTPLTRALASVDMSLVKGDVHLQWMKDLADIKAASQAVADAPNLQAAREAFDTLSTAMIRVAYRYGAGPETSILRYHCPMAFDNRGADWLQGAEPLWNPYFGAAMLRCGVLKGTIQAGAVTAPGSEGAHDGH